GRIEAATLSMALNDREPKNRAAAVRIAEPFLKGASTNQDCAALRAKVFGLTTDPSADVQTQLALSLGELAPDSTGRAILSNLVQRTSFALTRDCVKFALVAFDPPKIVVVKQAVLSPEEKKQFDAGKTVFEATCLACH